MSAISVGAGHFSNHAASGHTRASQVVSNASHAKTSKSASNTIEEAAECGAEKLAELASSNLSKRSSKPNLQQQMPTGHRVNKLSQFSVDVCYFEVSMTQGNSEAMNALFRKAVADARISH